MGIPADGVMTMPPSRPNLTLSVAHTERAADPADVVSLLKSPWLAKSKSIIIYVTMQVRWTLPSR